MATSLSSPLSPTSPPAPAADPAADADVLLRATAAFLHGFSFTRSFTHPYLVRQIEPHTFWVMRDAPRDPWADHRNEEWIALNVPPATVHHTVLAQTQRRHAISVIHANATPTASASIRQAYKALGYRLNRAEPLMTHDLIELPTRTSAATVQRVLDLPLARQLAATARTRQILPAHLHADAPLRAYVAMIGREIVGWVRSVSSPAGAWCSNMVVVPARRRQGIAAALLASMLRDDRAAGAPQSVLLASHVGAHLYPSVGYRPIGEALLFTPGK